MKDVKNTLSMIKNAVPTALATLVIAVTILIGLSLHPGPFSDLILYAKFSLWALVGASVLGLFLSPRLKEFAWHFNEFETSNTYQRKWGALSGDCLNSLLQFWADAPDSAWKQEVSRCLIDDLLSKGPDSPMALSVIFNRHYDKKNEWLRGECRRRQNQLSEERMAYVNECHSKGLLPESGKLDVIQQQIDQLQKIINQQSERESFNAGWRRVGELGTGEG